MFKPESHTASAFFHLCYIFLSGQKFSTILLRLVFKCVYIKRNFQCVPRMIEVTGVGVSDDQAGLYCIFWQGGTCLGDICPSDILSW